MRTTPSLCEFWSWHPVVAQEEITRGRIVFWKYIVSGLQLLVVVGSGSGPTTWFPGIWYLVQETAVRAMKATIVGAHLLNMVFMAQCIFGINDSRVWIVPLITAFPPCLESI